MTASAPISKKQDRRLEARHHRLVGPVAVPAAGGSWGEGFRCLGQALSTCPTTSPTSTWSTSARSRRACRPASGAGWGRPTTSSSSRVSSTSWRHKAGKDPVAFRLSMLDKAPRLRTALRLAADKAGGARPCPPRCGRGRRRPTPPSPGWIATVAEVEVDNEGAVNLRRVVCAVDTGIAVNPDTITAQLQGGIIFGLTAALHGQITVAQGRVQQSNFHDYRMLRIDETAAHRDPSHSQRRGPRRTSARPAPWPPCRRWPTPSSPPPASGCGACGRPRLPGGDEEALKLGRLLLIVVAAVAIVGSPSWPGSSQVRGRWPSPADRR